MEYSSTAVPALSKTSSEHTDSAVTSMEHCSTSIQAKLFMRARYTGDNQAYTSQSHTDIEARTDDATDITESKGNFVSRTGITREGSPKERAEQTRDV